MIGDIFTLLLLNPLVNLLVLLSHVLWGSFGLAIIAFTILVRVATFPLTLRQLHATRAMQALQPRVQEINKKYSDPKRRQEEMMKLYREGGANPLSCLGPILLTFPVFIAQYRSVPGWRASSLPADHMGRMPLPPNFSPEYIRS